MFSKVIDIGVDWITATCKDELSSAKLMHHFIRQFWPSEGQLPLVSRFTSHGFVGRAVTGARWGIRGDEAMIQLSSAQANKHWLEALELADNVTRLDLQVTVELEKPFLSVGQSAYNVIADHKRVKGTFFKSSQGGSTCYVGSRKSRYFGRLYDKGAQENKEPGRRWRYEVEIKKPQALPEAIRLGKELDIKAAIGAFVHTWFLERGIIPHFTPGFTLDAIEAPKILTNEMKMLQWLSKQVKPAVGKLINSGRDKEVYKALGLPEPGDMDIFSRFQEDI